MDVQTFLELYGNVIFREDYLAILKYQEQQEKYKNIEKRISPHGVHYEICPWSADTARCGPDSCECVLNGLFEQRVKRKINLYLRMFCKVKANNVK